MPAKVLVIYTGGTIGSAPMDAADPTSPLRPLGQGELTKFIPNPLDGVDWTIIGLTDDQAGAIPPLDSSSVGPTHWAWMAKSVERHYYAYDGFVILHGTDTMAYTASALSFAFENLAKPVVVTGSQLPIFKTRTDAVNNFAAALCVAGGKAAGLPCVPEVMIAFADRLLRGNRAVKVSTSSWIGFDSPSYPPLGRLGNRIVINPDLAHGKPNAALAPFRVRANFDPRVMVVPIFPGMPADQIRAVLNLANIQAYALLTFGAGNAPECSGFLTALTEAVIAGKTIVNVSQCIEGEVEMGLYAASSGLRQAGVISGADITIEAAVTKLMWLLGNVAENGEAGGDALKHAWRNLRGEQT